MAVPLNPFDSWLSSKLESLNTDEGVFGSYIRGILEGDETEDEKTEALESILAGIMETDISKHVSEILEMWTKFKPETNLSDGRMSAEDVDIQLAKMLESQCLPTTSQKNYTEEERRIRESILAQYSQMTDEEQSEGEGSEEGASGGGENLIEKNTNVLEKEKREKAKRLVEMEKDKRKKEKDKEDREKQKQLKEEKKEKRKTQKGERRR